MSVVTYIDRSTFIQQLLYINIPVIFTDEKAEQSSIFTTIQMINDESNALLRFYGTCSYINVSAVVCFLAVFLLWLMTNAIIAAQMCPKLLVGFLLLH